LESLNHQGLAYGGPEEGDWWYVWRVLSQAGLLSKWNGKPSKKDLSKSM
jgi:hypothetical protein